MRFGDLHDAAELHHLAFVIARLQTGNVFGVGAERGIGLGHDFEGAAKAVEVVHIKRAEINLERIEKILQRDSLRLRFLPVHVRIQLRHIHGERGEHAAERGVLVALADDVLQILIEGVVTKIGAVFDVEFETADGAQPHHRGRWHGEHESFLDGAELLVQGGRDGRAAQVAGGAFFKRF